MDTCDGDMALHLLEHEDDKACIRYHQQQKMRQIVVEFSNDD